MAAQLLQQNLLIAPEQALIQLLSILAGDKYEVEKRTFRNGRMLNRGRVFNVNVGRAGLGEMLTRLYCK